VKLTLGRSQRGDFFHDSEEEDNVPKLFAKFRRVGELNRKFQRMNANHYYPQTLLMLKMVSGRNVDEDELQNTSY